MMVRFGNLVTFTKLGNKEKMQELESKLVALGYSNESDCKANKDKTRKTWHIFENPKAINFSVLDAKTIALLQEYSEHFEQQIVVTISE